MGVGELERPLPPTGGFSERTAWGGRLTPLRRDRRRVDARAQLRVAHDHFTSIGMEAFAKRARNELQATGEKVRKRTVEARDDLPESDVHLVAV